MNSIAIAILAKALTILTPARPSENESGEGVVSAAIAVVIFSTLGVAMWYAFRNTMNTATSMVTSQVAQLAN